MRKFLLLVPLLLLLIPGHTPGDWPAPCYQWEQCPDDSDCWGLRLNGVQVGAWRRDTDIYCPLMTGRWAESCAPPIAPPIPPVKTTCPCCGDDCDCAVKPCGKPNCHCVLQGGTVESDGTLNFGIDRDWWNRSPKRTLNGREVSRATLLEAIGKPNIPDDASWLALTVIGTEADRQAVLTDLANSSLLSPWKGKLKIQDYDPSNWAVANSGFFTGGKPTIYLQDASGKVLHRQDDYRGAEKLAQALRDSDPNYQPKNDPDKNKPISLPALSDIQAKLAEVPGWAWLAAGVLLYLWWNNRQEKAK